MTALHMVRDGALLAAELAALLFVPPAIATPPAPSARELHALASAVDLRLLDSLASVRLVQAVRNDDDVPLDLAPRLPASDLRVESVRVAQGGRTVELFSADGACDAEESGPHEGHAQTTPDELRADLLTLPTAGTARIEIVATGRIDRAGTIALVELPATSAPLPAQAWLLTDGTDTRLVAVLPHGIRGTATLTVRPARGPTEQVALGTITSPMVVVTLATSASADQLARGAIELEATDAGRVTWTTLPFVRNSTVAVVDRAR